MSGGHSGRSKQLQLTSLLPKSPPACNLNTGAARVACAQSPPPRWSDFDFEGMDRAGEKSMRIVVEEESSSESASRSQADWKGGR